MTGASPRVRALVIILASVIGAATVAWAGFTANPTSITIDCGGDGYGTQTFQITWDGSGCNTVTLSPQGGCTGYDMNPIQHTYSSPSEMYMFQAVADMPQQAACTWELHYNPQTDTPPTVVVNVTNCGAPGGTLDVDPQPELDFGVVPDGQTWTETFTVYNNTGVELTSIDYTIVPGAGGVFAFFPGCPGQYSCGQTWPPGFGVPNGQMVMNTPPIRCTGTPSGMHTATLQVSGNAGSAMGSTTLRCDGAPAQNGPQINVASSLTIVPDVDVFAGMGSASLQIDNGGDADLVISGVTPFGGPSGDWTLTGCVSSCTIGPGLTDFIDITFDPSAVFDRSISIAIDTNDADPGDDPRYVDLFGAGLGGIVTANPSSPYTFHFTDQPIGVPSSPLSLTFSNAGNQSLDVTPSIVGPDASDFSITPSGMTPVLTSTQFDITCTASATGLRQASLVVVAPRNIGPPTSFTYELRCNGIVAALDINPSPVAFLPTRAGNARMITVHVHNPAGAAVPAPVGPITLSSPDEGFSISGMGVGSQVILAPDQEITFDVTFAPEVANEGMRMALLENIEAGNPRVVSVTGTATVPRFQAVPAVHDFNRVCVGESVDQDFALMVSPSADIRVVNAVLTGDARFDSAFVDPNGYPVTLAPGMSATVNVRTTVEAGEYNATLAWETDVLGSEQTQVPIHVIGIAEGLAVSPGSFSFGVVPAGMESPPQAPRLQSCDATAVVVTAAIVDDAAQAFRLAGPPSATITDVESMPWSVTYAPPEDRAHHAVLRLTPDMGDPVDISLDGGADVTPGGGVTNYYACGCNAPLTAGGVVPALIVLAWVVARRRRSESP
jgi:hypothetical protein